MDLTVKETSVLFEVDENIVFSWIREKGLPAYRIMNQFRINSEKAFEWAAVNGIRISPVFINAAFKSQDAMPSLSDTVSLGGIYYGLDGVTVNDILTSAVNVMPLPDSVEKEFLLQMLIARESMGSTGVGDGIAIPHPRNPIVLSIDRPVVAVVFPAQPIDFKAIDNKPVVVFFVLISHTVRAHLHLLSRIAFTIQNPAVKRLLHDKAPQDQIITALKSAEADITCPDKQPV
jgi:nitrogen PTS system EIIA component